MKSLRSVIYVFGTVAIVATLYAAGLFPAGLSASEKLAATWAASSLSLSEEKDMKVALLPKWRLRAF